MMIQNLFQPRTVTKGIAIWPLLRRAQQGLSRIGYGLNKVRGETDLCRLSALPSCCFAHFADRQK
jgi:hypothetical protein